MAFLWGQELTQEVWSFLVDLSTELLAWRFLRRGLGLGTKQRGLPGPPGAYMLIVHPESHRGPVSDGPSL